MKNHNHEDKWLAQHHQKIKGGHLGRGSVFAIFVSPGPGSVLGIHWQMICACCGGQPSIIQKAFETSDNTAYKFIYSLNNF